jgi:hypothetical protein
MASVLKKYKSPDAASKPASPVAKPDAKSPLVKKPEPEKKPETPKPKEAEKPTDDMISNSESKQEVDNDNT